MKIEDVYCRPTAKRTAIVGCPIVASWDMLDDQLHYEVRPGSAGRHYNKIISNPVCESNQHIEVAYPACSKGRLLGIHQRQYALVVKLPVYDLQSRLIQSRLSPSSSRISIRFALYIEIKHFHSISPYQGRANVSLK